MRPANIGSRVIARRNLGSTGTPLGGTIARPWTYLLWLACLVACGCNLPTPSLQYGGVKYPEKNSSINGLGIFEKLCTQAGSRCFVASRLSKRLDKADAIILVGTSFHPPAKEARDWLEQWLAEAPGRSVVYFGRDFDADVYYRQETLAQIPVAERRRATLELSMARAELDALLYSDVKDDAFCRWFHLKIHEPRRDAGNFTGDWATDLQSSEATWPVRVTLEPPRPEQSRERPKWIAPPNASSPFTPKQPVAREEDAEAPEIYYSVWSESDINNDETWDEEWSKAPSTEVLLSDKSGAPLVCRLTSERYAGSQILTLVNGAPLLNGSIVKPHFMNIAHKVVSELQPAKRIALLPFDADGILVSNVEDENEVAGLSVLTTWPMNIIVAHLAFLGVLVCLALFPILGRPQGVRKHSLSDFGQHAEAVGRMLQRTGDQKYALQVVADYYRTVRGEALPTWLKSALQPTAPMPQPAIAEPIAADCETTPSPTGSNPDSSA